MHGEFIGFTVEGGPIVRFTNSSAGSLPRHNNAELLGYCSSNRPIIAYRKDSIQFLSQGGVSVPTSSDRPGTANESENNEKQAV
jgi:hypothetical protein